MSPRISLFVTCMVDQLFPRVGLAMAEVLERAGCRVEFPEGQTCCGQPAFNSGYRDDACAVAKYHLTVFKDSEYVVVPSGSCTSMIAHHYSAMIDSDEARAMAAKTYEFSQFLTDVLKVEDVGAELARTVTFHDSCHGLRELGIKQGPRRLLSHVRGLTICEMDYAEECCGFGGTFSVKFPEVSGAMSRTKIESILRTGASTVVGVDASCLMQLRGTLQREGHPVDIMHLAEVLACR
jgi:L-lactate dehydrogenase complex protein LldE